MNSTTTQALIELNNQFYLQAQASFHESRATGWQGWEKLLPSVLQLINQRQLDRLQRFSLLDIGCGNGRFSKFLADNLPAGRQLGDTLAYFGLDSNQFLLDMAKKELAKQPFAYTKLLKADFLTDILDNTPLDLPESFDAIVVFGVYHHIPSLELRKKVIAWCEQRLNQNGLLILTFWQFAQDQKLVTRVGELPPDLRQLQLDFEAGDYFLDWQRVSQQPDHNKRSNQTEHPFRYCHLVTPAEQQELIKGLNLKPIAQFTADGKTNNSNQYLVLEKI